MNGFNILKLSLKMSFDFDLSDNEYIEIFLSFFYKTGIYTHMWR